MNLSVGPRSVNDCLLTRSHVPALRASQLARVTATLLLLCLGFLVGESLVADACDGDAAAPRGQRAWVALGDTLGVPDSASRPVDEGAPSSGQHSTHIDHCAHPHASGLAAHAAAPWFPPQRPTELRVTAMLAPPDPVLQPSIRPPIA